MGQYQYKATDQRGTIHTGVLEADGAREAAAQLGEQGYIPLKIRAVEKRGATAAVSVFRKPFSGWGRGRVSGKDVQLFTQDLAALIKAGLPLDRSLEILIEAAGPGRQGMRPVAVDILRSVEKGQYLSAALAQHPRVFNRFYVSMVRAGEAGGVIEETLDRMGAYLESSQELKDYVSSAMLYPAFLLGVGLISVFLLLTFVIPRFSMIFETMGQAIPLATQILLTLSGVLRTWWWLFLLVVAVLVLAVAKYFATTTGRSNRDRWLLGLPLAGDLVRKIEVARFTRTLGTLAHSGVPLLQALELVMNILSNREVVKALATVPERVKKGDKLAGPLQESGVFPPLAIQMIMVGEETGQLDVMLLRVAENYEKVVRNLVKKFVNMLEPMLILFMGVLIGGIVISMLMAIFSMNDLPF